MRGCYHRSIPINLDTATHRRTFLTLHFHRSSTISFHSAQRSLMTAFNPLHSKSSSSQIVSSLHVIYDADGTLTGELVYILKKLLGISHCAACEITHGPRREKPEFTQLKASAWGVPVHNIHRDEMDPNMAKAVAGVLPCVVARTPVEDVILLGPVELEACGGNVYSFETAVNHAVDNLGLFVPRSLPVCDFARIQDHAIERRKSQLHHHNDVDQVCDDAVVPGSPS